MRKLLTTVCLYAALASAAYAQSINYNMDAENAANQRAIEQNEMDNQRNQMQQEMMVQQRQMEDQQRAEEQQQRDTQNQINSSWPNGAYR